MRSTRRRFLAITAALGASAAARSWMHPQTAWAAAASGAGQWRATGEVMAATPATFWRAYRSKPSSSPHVLSWVQVDLGRSLPIDAVKLYPACERGYPFMDAYYGGEGFPLRFKIEASEDSGFARPRMLFDGTQQDFPDLQGGISEYMAPDVRGRYVRLTAAELRPVKSSQRLGAYESSYTLTLAKMEVLSGGRDVAVGCAVTADPVYGNPELLRQVTRPLRPQGEGTVTNHPENVLPAQQMWRVACKVETPVTGVTLQGGVFQAAMENNIAYLLHSFTVDELLRQFRERAGKPNPPGLPKPDPFWEEDLAGSNAGRFLMGAGNTVRWIDHPELQRRMDAVVDGVGSCREANGYMIAYPPDTIFYSERGAYTRAWVTHGLLEAGYAGNAKAFPLLRGYYDWFNQCEYLPKLLRAAVQGGQGMVANTRVCVSPVGKPQDAQIIQQYFQENYWLSGLAQENKEAVWQYPYDRPHCYLLTNLEAYADMYTATGDPRYRDAVLGGWKLYRENWEQIGGSISIIEFENDPPESNYLHQKLGENCGSSFWILLNQRLHRHDPENEQYVAEIEKSIYNVVLANQGGTDGIRYHTMLTGKKEEPTHMNSCCEGQGTRMLGALPEHIYSLAPDGVYINLFEPSTLQWEHAGHTMQLRMETRFPFAPEVKLHCSTAKPTKANLRIRVPGWAADSMAILVNGKHAALGKPGSYVALHRVWRNGDTIAFTLPVAFRMTLYTGGDRKPGQPQYALEYGPVLMAAVGPPEAVLRVQGSTPQTLIAQLRPKSNEPLHFDVEHNPDTVYMPYWQVNRESFTCFPVVQLA